MDIKNTNSSLLKSLFYILLCFLNLHAFSQNCPTTSVVNGYPNITSPKCGQNNGIIEMKANGVGAITYSLSEFGTYTQNGNFNGLSSGRYTIYMKDGNNCVETFFTTLESISGAEIIDIVVKDSSCETNDGTITVSATGEELRYKINNGPLQTNNVFTGIAGGEYVVSVTDKNDCETRQNVQVKQGSLFIESIVRKPSSCAYKNGQITVNATSDSTIEYQIEGRANWQSSNVFRNLLPGNYTVNVKDEDGCLLSSRVTIPDLFNVEMFIIAPVCGESDGSVQFVVSPAATYEFSIDGGDSFNRTGFFDDLVEGNYKVLVRGIGNDCERSYDFSIVQDVITIPNVELLVTETSCTDNTGIIEVQVSINDLTYELYKLDEELRQFQFVEENTTGIFTNLAFGSYQVYIETKDGCRTAAFAELVEIDNDIEFRNDDLTLASCNTADGSIRINAYSTKGESLTYKIEGGEFSSNSFFENLATGSYLITVRSETGCETIRDIFLPDDNNLSFAEIITSRPTDDCSKDGTIEAIVLSQNVEYSLDNITFQTSNLFTGLGPGIYTIYLRNPRGCVRESGEIIFPGDIIIVSIDVVDDACEYGEGQVEVEATGENLMYSLDDINFQESHIFRNLEKGNYTVHVSNGSDCEVSRSFVVENNGLARITDVEALTTSCGLENGVANIKFLNQGGSYRFKIDNGEYQKGTTFTDLSAGIHIAKIINDDDGCLGEFEFEVPESFPIVITEEIYCANPTADIIVEATGGVGELTYSINGSTFTSNNEFVGLNAGDHTLTVKDEVGCEETTIIQIGRVDISNLDVTTTSCGEVNGSVIVNFVNYGDEYSFQLNGGNFQTSNEFKFIPPGEHTVTIMDNLGCTDSETFTINESFPIETNLNDILEICSFQEGTITVKASGGVGQLQYSISNKEFQTSNVFSDLENGQYFIQVKDEVNCTVDAIVEIGNPCVVLFPTAISPNNDGNNDIFKALYHEDLLINEFEVFNRWGEKIYSQHNFNSADIDKWWNASSIQDGVYLANVVYELNGEQKAYAGTFLVLK